MTPENHKRSLLIATLSVVVLVGALVVGVLTLGHVSFPGFSKPLTSTWKGGGSGQVQVQVTQGETLSEVGGALQKSGVVEYAGSWASVADAGGGQGLTPGWYVLHAHMGDEDALTLMLAPESRAHTHAEVQEGKTLKEVEAALSSALVLTGTWDEAETSVHGRWGTSLEGQIGVGAYDFPLNTSTTAVLSALEKRFEEVKVTPIPGLSEYDTLKVASIAEKEVLSADWPKVSRVVQNRLAMKMPLQMDSIRAYEVASKGGFDAFSTPGLPPTPITTISGSAVRAVVEAPAADWVYFVTTDTQGTTLFTRYYEQFLQGVAQARVNGVLK